MILDKKNYDKGIDKGSTYSITTCGSNKDHSWNVLSCTLLNVFLSNCPCWFRNLYAPF